MSIARGEGGIFHAISYSLKAWGSDIREAVQYRIYEPEEERSLT